MKILYLMHVPWGWIKQRPHFIAEKLNEHYDVTVFYMGLYIKRSLVRNKNENDLKIKELFRLPLEGYNLISKINSYIIKFQLKKVINQFDLIWITNPYLFGSIENILPENMKVIYDCMDDTLEFPHIKSRTFLKEKLIKNEKKLINRSNIIFASAEYLKWKLINRYGPKKEPYIINNAINEKSFNSNKELPSNIDEKFKKSGFIISYIGTISNWFDLDLINESLDKFDNINYFLFGPSGIELPKHERIIYFGPVEHEYIFEIMDKSDVLIMPFKVTELIKSVDPVKLYEYIYSCKPIIASQYDETLKFSDFAYLYNSRSEYLSILKNIIDDNFPIKKNCKEHKEYSKNNSWEKRVEQIVKIIENS